MLDRAFLHDRKAKREIISPLAVIGKGRSPV